MPTSAAWGLMRWCEDAERPLLGKGQQEERQSWLPLLQKRPLAFTGSSKNFKGKKIFQFGLKEKTLFASKGKELKRFGNYFRLRWGYFWPKMKHWRLWFENFNFKIHCGGSPKRKVILQGFTEMIYFENVKPKGVPWVFGVFLLFFLFKWNFERVFFSKSSVFCLKTAVCFYSYKKLWGTNFSWK